ncbi:hypothetical protein G0R20_004407, partial [Salmonella enterica]|nr:hypothetical protein [Salmonella enterica]
LLDKHYISDVSNNSSQYHNDLQKFGNPPVLTESCIQLTTNETDALGMTCSIPKSFNTASLGQMYRQSFTGYFDGAYTETGTLNLDCTMTGDAVVTNINFANTAVATSFSALQFGSSKAYFSQNYRLENGEANCSHECLCYKNFKLSNNSKSDAIFINSVGTWVIDLEDCVFKNNNPVTPSWNFEVYENNT